MLSWLRHVRTSGGKSVLFYVDVGAYVQRLNVADYVPEKYPVIVGNHGNGRCCSTNSVKNPRAETSVSVYVSEI